MTYDGLESCIRNSSSYDNESGASRADGCPSDSLDDASSCSSTKDVFGSFSSQWVMNKQSDDCNDEWEEVSNSPQHFYVKEKPSYTIKFSDVETMKERFSKLLLGEDITGGCKGLGTALALSNAITNLAASVFGEFWKLEPLSEEGKSMWRREMDWLLSPTNHMVELVPAKQNGTNGGTLEIMTPKVRSDIHMNVPALLKLDSMLIEILDSMVNTEFWYEEGGNRAEGRSMTPSRRWWLPSPRVPRSGLSVTERKKLIHHSKMVHQVFKATKAINENVLLEIPVPTIIKNALPKSGRANLGEELYKVLNDESRSVEEMLNSLHLQSEHSALDTINRLETAVFAWTQKISEQTSGKSPVRNSWYHVKDTISELDKIELLLRRAESLLQLLKIRFPNLPRTFLDVTKVQYNKDIGHSILEAYSRVLGSLAFSILSRIGDILQEDVLSNPNSPVASCCFPGVSLTGIFESPAVDSRICHSLIDQMNRVDGQFCESSPSKSSDVVFSDGETKTSSVTSTPCRSRVWCIGRETCRSVPLTNSP
ncbi:PREDICTED: rop guanine nucleotide exchange factor 14 isoform X2 [Nelumbo nucifera]|nr:PREDICTED: rop guanine nucleotide exchange factor 14 isoform X2 [Nelumbo nucifera]